MQFDLKSAELPLAGYTLVLRGPTLHQHQAVLKTLAELDGKTIMATLQPILDAAKTDAEGAVTTALLRAVPAIVGALRTQLMEHGVDLLFRAAAICLDSRANHRRLSAKCPDADYDDARIGDYDRGPDGSTYLECEGLQAWVRQTITIDAAIWVVFSAAGIGGYGDLGKAAASAIIGGLRKATLAAPAAPTQPSAATGPITA
ncbi:MAG: hypothetical protein KBF21_18295 [Thermoanaerobaculia bacterium]|jgi:hypothetical protein|nr:hypothetical protein [Thermoanaerobaculia bacterium]